MLEGLNSNFPCYRTRTRTARMWGLAFALAALLCTAAPSVRAQEDTCGQDCRAERAMCRADARGARHECAASCDEGDRPCRAACREAFAESNRLCAVAVLGCHADRRDDLDPACVDGSVDDFDLCTADALDCAMDCHVAKAEAIAQCRTLADGEADVNGKGCVRAAIANGRACLHECRAAHRCRAEAKQSLEECVLP